MPILLIVFIVLAGLMCVTGVTLLSVGFAQDNKHRKEQKAELESQRNSIALAAVAQSSAPADGAVVFAANKPTHQAKYQALSDEQRGWYDEIVNYVSQIEGIKSISNDRYEEYKLSSRRVVRMTIRRGVIVCEYMLGNPGVSKYMAENKVKIKQSPTVLKVTSANEVGAAKDTIDIAVSDITEMRRQAKEAERERRRQSYKERQAAAHDKKDN